MEVNFKNLLYKQSYTDNGNKYVKTNAGKTVGTALCLSNFVMKYASIGKDRFEMLRKAADCDVKTARKIVGKYAFRDLVTGLILMLGVGAAIDALVNKISAKITDKKAKDADKEDLFETSFEKTDDTDCDNGLFQCEEIPFDSDSESSDDDFYLECDCTPIDFDD